MVNTLTRSNRKSLILSLSATLILLLSQTHLSFQKAGPHTGLVDLDMDPFAKQEELLLDLKDKTMNQVTLEDLIELPHIKPYYKVFSVAHLLSNLVFDFCWLGKTLVLHDDFLAMFIRQYGVKQDQFERALDTETQLKMIYPTADKPKIELYTHRAWFASPWNPMEIFDYLPNQTYFDRILSTNKILDSEGYKWTHIIWTNDRSLAPKTFKWFEDNGMQVKEFKELPYDKLIHDKFNDYIQEGNFGKAVDLTKGYTSYHYGGMYLDIDVYISAWTNKWLHNFDSIWIRELDIKFGMAIFNNDLYLTKSKHPVFEKYLQIYRQQYEVSVQEQPLQQSRCMNATNAKTPYEAGIHMSMVAWVLEYGKHDTADIALYPKNTKRPQQYKIRVSETEEVIYPIQGNSVYICSWMDNYGDALNFGFF